MKQITIIEGSNNPHTTKSKVQILEQNGTEMFLKTNGELIIEHGEHHTITIKAPFIEKSLQQEYNPVTKLFDAAFD